MMYEDVVGLSLSQAGLVQYLLIDLTITSLSYFIFIKVESCQAIKTVLEMRLGAKHLSYHINMCVNINSQ